MSPAATGGDDGSAAKRARTLSPDDLEEGTPVIYYGGKKGLIRDAYGPLDEFWISDVETGEVVKDKVGNIVTFKSADLQLLRAPPAPLDNDDESGVLIIGREEHMVKILEHFGAPTAETRCNPQQLIAIPCNACDPSKLGQMAEEGIAEDVVALGKRQRSDIHVGVRATQLKQVVEKIGQELLVLEGFYILGSVQLPHSLDEIEAAGLNMWESHRRREVYNQIDLSVSATTQHPQTEEPEMATRRALGQTCGVEISDTLWSEQVQIALRQKLNVELPSRFQDASGKQIVVTLLPDDAAASKLHGVLCFTESLGADYLKPMEPPIAAPAPAGAEASKDDDAGGQTLGGKTVREWETDQEKEFGDLPKLPAGWIRIKSRSNGGVYFFNKKTKESTFDFPEGPLPPGWTKQVSKSTGKSYYFHNQKKISTFDRPEA